MIMVRLTDTQRVLLSAAAARKNLSLFPAPESLTLIGNALDRAIAGLVKRGLATETRARSVAAIWRRDDEGVRIGLVITPAGLAAMGVEDGEAGAQAEPADARTADRAAGPVGRPGGKLGEILAAVEAAGGATIGELAEASAWQPHTTRAALTRLRQRGFDIRLEAIGERKAYRLQAAG
jgi:hypothetical protein